MALRLSAALTLTLAILLGANLPAARAADAAELAVAQAGVELACSRLGQFDQVEYPMELRRLDDALRLLEAEIEVLEFRLVEYEPFNRVKYGAALMATVQDLELTLLDARQEHRRLREEKMLLVRLRPAHRAALLAEIAAAEALLAELER